MTREDLINQRATTCRHGGHCEWVACDKCNHYEAKPETITGYTKGQADILDKIKAEIKETADKIRNIRNDNLCFFTEQDVLQIIDKYREVSNGTDR